MSYSEEDHLFIEKNIRRVSLVSIVGSLLLCLAVYPNVQIVFLSLLPTGLGILWTTGIAAISRRSDLISLSFIAILAGLGDDRWCTSSTARRRSGRRAAASTTPCCAPLKPREQHRAVHSDRGHFDGRAGLLRLQGALGVWLHPHRGHVHDGLAHAADGAALMQLWDAISSRCSQGHHLPFLPAVARVTVDFAGRHARAVVIAAAGLFLVSLCLLPSLRWGKLVVESGADSPD